MAPSRAPRRAGVNWAEEGASRGQGSRRVQTGAFTEPPGQHGQSGEELQGGWCAGRGGVRGQEPHVAADTDGVEGQWGEGRRVLLGARQQEGRGGPGSLLQPAQPTCELGQQPVQQDLSPSGQPPGPSVATGLCGSELVPTRHHQDGPWGPSACCQQGPVHRVGETVPSNAPASDSSRQGTVGYYLQAGLEHGCPAMALHVICAPRPTPRGQDQGLEGCESPGMRALHEPYKRLSQNQIQATETWGAGPGCDAYPAPAPTGLSTPFPLSFLGATVHSCHSTGRGDGGGQCGEAWPPASPPPVGPRVHELPWGALPSSVTPPLLPARG
ncbi:collagen alpha-1(I) chain-like [Meles meles]|uniref:collagen alpha-1(I) chain-like n=1 Tax=Meles meles TaxID=9662 RepID=UPI001E698B25|nr:collagen alpha-1(I) chain-like [Meles meles]